MIHTLNKAFTLMELIIYIALTSVIITFFASFAFNLSGGVSSVRNKGDEQTEMLFVMERIVREIENSNGINTDVSVFDVNPSSLAVVGTYGVTFIELTPDGIIQLRQPEGETFALTTPSIIITGLIFTNESRPKRPGVIHIKIMSSAFDTAFETAVAYRKLIEI